MSVVPYIFWCSKCKKDHGGECDVIEEYKPAQAKLKPGVTIAGQFWPAVGSRWFQDTKGSRSGVWITGYDVTYTVTAVDHKADRIQLDQGSWWSREAWDPKGMPAGWRMVPAP